MKIIGFLMLAAFFAINQASAADLERDFIRKAGHYSLDKQGSTLAITKQPTGSWSLKVIWRSGSATSSTEASVEPRDCLLAEGWFVFVENPTRIWIFDGVDAGLLVSHSEKETGSKSYPAAAMRAGPRKFWDALPEAVRAKYRKEEQRRQ